MDYKYEIKITNPNGDIYDVLNIIKKGLNDLPCNTETLNTKEKDGIVNRLEFLCRCNKNDKFLLKIMEGVRGVIYRENESYTVRLGISIDWDSVQFSAFILPLTLIGGFLGFGRGNRRHRVDINFFRGDKGAIHLLVFFIMLCMILLYLCFEEYIYYRGLVSSIYRCFDK